MNLPEGIDPARFKALVQLARDEDLGAHGDLTGALLPEWLRNTDGRWALRLREAGRFCGRPLLHPLLAELAPEVAIDWLDAGEETTDVPGDTIVARLSGRADQMLAAERTLLNFFQRLGGVATHTSRFVRRVAGAHVKIYDTRKTIPGWRDLDKYAVRCGGGHSHRRGLHDAVLIKDNHLAGVAIERIAHTVFEMLGALDRIAPTAARFVEVEADSLAQLDELLKVVGIDVILLDNFSLADLAEAVRRRDRAGLRGKVELEASGGVALETVGDVAATGVDRIAIGALTHSAPALDIGLDAIA
ncbi:MAG: carboxylating nicotinate-nucleotide diphosphorylase [Phycisphaerae bacterium]|nr:carboxylating nicotinate-nucleotide diphosphorylase [Phycisphaerae bacterium]NUQ46625.1 carboxylating nicotinate-nucleotide diphosphorylase [Phycisphaerae bacterium]